MTTRNNTLPKAVTVPVSAAVGIGLGYLLDPDRGKARRHRLRDQAAAALRRQRRRTLAQTRFRLGRLRGRLLTSVGGGMSEPVDDVEVKRQVHQALRASGVSTSDLTIEVSDRKVVLRGQAPNRADIDRLVQLAHDIPGVATVTNLLHEPGEPAPNKVDALRLSHSARS